MRSIEVKASQKNDKRSKRDGAFHVHNKQQSRRPTDGPTLLVGARNADIKEGVDAGAAYSFGCGST